MIWADVLILRDGFADPTYGVNRQLESLPLEPGHRRPEPIKQVMSVLTDARAALMQAGADQAVGNAPAIVLLADEPTRWDGEVATAKRDGECTVLACVITRQGDPDRANLEAAYYLHAMVRTVRELMALDPNLPARKKGGVSLVSVRNIEASLQGVPLKDSSVIAGSLALTCFTRDTQP